MTECLTNSILANRYKIIGEVGRGRSAAVYKGVDLTTGHSVAVKVLGDAVRPDQKTLLRFEREAKTASSLNHPNIAKVRDSGVYRDRFPFVVMDYVNGMLLGTRVRVEGRLSLQSGLPIFLQICDAMSYAHDHGVIHRDLRPDNIFLEARSNEPDLVKIVDFGVAKNLNESSETRLTAEGEVLGAPEFMSPEEITCSSELDCRADVYSMGCLMFNVLSGQLPFSGNNKVEVMAQQLRSEPKDFSDPSCGRHLPPGVQLIVKKALNKNPAERHQSMHELKELLQSYVKK